MCFICFPIEHPLGCGFRMVGVNESMIVTGCLHDPSSIVSSGRVFVWPLQLAQYIDHQVFTVEIVTNNVLSSEAIPVDVIGVAQLQLGGSPELTKLAATHFLSWSQKKIHSVCLEVLEGHQRGIVSFHTVTELIADKAKLQEAVELYCHADLEAMGVRLISYTLKDIDDSNGFLLMLGEKITAEKKSEARIAECTARARTQVAEIQNYMSEMQKHYENQILIAESKKNKNLKTCANLKVVSKQEAETDLANALQTAIRGQEVMTTQMNTKVYERKRAVDLEKNECTKEEARLKYAVYAVADADAKQIKQEANAKCKTINLEAEGRSQTLKEKGDADAYALKQKGEAEGENLAKKAEAWEKYGEAAVYDMVYDAIPKMAGEIRNNLDGVEKITVVSDKPASSRMTNEVKRIVQTVPTVVDEFTGLNMHETIESAIKERAEADSGVKMF